MSVVVDLNIFLNGQTMAVLFTCILSLSMKMAVYMKRRGTNWKIWKWSLCGILVCLLWIINNLQLPSCDAPETVGIMKRDTKCNLVQTFAIYQYMKVRFLGKTKKNFEQEKQ